jgi:hypothetical protein
MGVGSGTTCRDLGRVLDGGGRFVHITVLLVVHI